MDKFKVEKIGLEYRFICKKCNENALIRSHCHPYYYYDEEDEYYIIEIICKECSITFKTNKKDLDRDLKLNF